MGAGSPLDFIQLLKSSESWDPEPSSQAAGAGKKFGGVSGPLACFLLRWGHAVLSRKSAAHFGPYVSDSGDHFALAPCTESQLARITP